MNVNIGPAYQCSGGGNCFVRYDENMCSVGYSIGLIDGVNNSVNRMEEDSPCSSDVRIPIKRQDKNDLINNLVEEISSLSISQKYSVTNRRNRGNVLKVRLKDSDTALGNRKVINVQFMDSERDVETTIKGTFNQKVDKNLVKQGGGTRKPRGKTQGVSKKD